MICDLPEVPDGFTIIREIPGSSLGRTVVAQREGEIKRLVIKCVPRSRLGNAAQISTFLETIRNSMCIKCKFLCPYQDLIETQDFIYLVRPFVSGISLTEDVSNKCTSDLNTYVVIWRIVLRSVQVLHQCGVSPCFIRPCNIFLDHNREPILVDIYPPVYESSQKIQNPSNLSFLAPEVFTQDTTNPQSSDVWSLTVLLIYMLTGQIPWNTQNTFKMMRQIMDGHPGICIKIPDEIRPIVVRTLIPDQKARATIDWLKDQAITVSNIAKTYGSGEKLRRAGGLPQRSAILRLPLTTGIVGDRRRSLASFVHKSTVWSQQRFS